MHYVVCIRPSLERDNQSASPQSTPFITAVLLLEFNSFYIYAFAEGPYWGLLLVESAYQHFPLSHLR